ncbi:MAG: hypothetical protein IJV54_00080 [Bacteroidales bacterium]|nr:hypothetical protein [Bacteroidales bacterium]
MNSKKREIMMRDVERLLSEKQWSAEQISGYLRKQGKFINEFHCWTRFWMFSLISTSSNLI